MEQYKCMGFKRKFSWRRAQPPGDVRDAFAAYAAGAAHMGADQLRRFLHEEQGESAATLGDAERTAAELLSRRSQTSAPGIDLDSFFYFLMSPDLNPCIGHQVHQDMSSPLSHYYIFTGHNSYLTGNQLSSDCSDIPIIQALQRGVRVIELDMWPNSTKDNVDILHGRTLTSPVDMIKCLRAIKEFAFCASPYPVVITLEDHLTPDLQAKVAEMILQIFGDLLYYPSSDSLEEFPSPESLKNRVIISTKPPKEYLESKNCNDREDSPHKGSKSSNWEDSPHKGSKSSNWEDSPHKGSKSSNWEDSPHKGSKGSNWEDSPHKGSKGSNYGGERNDVADIKALCISNDKNGQDEEEYDDDNEDDDELGVQQNSAPGYRSIITIHAGKPTGRLSHALKVDPFKARRLSLSEEQLQKLAESNGPDLVRFTQKNILRIYPKGTRITSSNYNPLLGWIHGAQMVAFNMQGHGKPLWLMQGLFRANGGCGYVRKPDFLLENGPNGEVFNPEASSPVKTTLKVRVYMGDGWNMDFEQTYFDTYSPPDFYTKLKIVGVPADSRKRKTKIIKDDWIPLWEEEFSFPLTVPELALLRVEVREHDVSGKDDFGGQTCLPVRELKRGIRAVPLHDHKGNKYNSVRLLMRFQFT